MKAIEDVAKYAREKRFPKRVIDDMIQSLLAENGEYIDDDLYYMLCDYIDGRAEYWDGVRDFLRKQKEERDRRMNK